MDVDHAETDDSLTDDERKFLLDLEFVQCLGNPKYLNFLAIHPNKYFDDKSFISYLSYLQYWKQPSYAKYIKYPHCLHFLDRLQDPNFRVQLSNIQFVKHIEDQQSNQWRYASKQRELEAIASPTPPQNPSSGPSKRP